MGSNIVACCRCGACVALPDGFRVDWNYRCPDCYKAERATLLPSPRKPQPPNIVVRQDAVAVELRSLAVQVEQLRRAIEALVA